MNNVDLAIGVLLACGWRCKLLESDGDTFFFKVKQNHRVFVLRILKETIYHPFCAYYRDENNTLMRNHFGRDSIKSFALNPYNLAYSETVIYQPILDEENTFKW